MADKYRCPNCNAVIPQGAAWCSLCLTDVRPDPATPLPQSLTLVGGGAPSASTAASGLRKATSSSASGSSRRGTLLSRETRARPTGRHSSGSARPVSSPVDASRPDLLPADFSAAGPIKTSDSAVGGAVTAQSPVSSQISPETERWAQQVLTELRHAEPGLMDPQTAPGGKWGRAAIGTTGVIVVLLVVYTVLGVIIGR